jgi:DNA (cytosine-5)-methyltransferase 1
MDACTAHARRSVAAEGSKIIYRTFVRNTAILTPYSYRKITVGRIALLKATDFSNYVIDSDQDSVEVTLFDASKSQIFEEEERMRAAQFDDRNAFHAVFAEFFAGIGLVRAALEPLGFSVAFANDIEPKKQRLYNFNFEADADFVCSDISTVRGTAVPDIDLATASFPCTDLSLAGNREGLAGKESGTFYEFARVLHEMDTRRPSVVMLENVIGFATSNGGNDLRTVLKRMNLLGYACDLFVLDAKWFVAQSRPRLFIVSSRRSGPDSLTEPQVSEIRPKWLVSFIRENSDIDFSIRDLPSLPVAKHSLDKIVEKMHHNDKRWWDATRLAAFRTSLLPRHSERLAAMTRRKGKIWATAYRRTRNGRATWEIRPDGIAGCLRTTRGGSSRQAIVEAGNGTSRVRWMTGAEYAALQGAADFRFSRERESEAIFAFGDAVCVPAVAWIGENYLKPLISNNQRASRRRNK